MKGFLLIFVSIAIATLCYAGIDDFYTFNATTGTYTPITGTQITDNLSDDALSAEIQIGFSFPYGESSYTGLKVSSNGWVGFGPNITHSNLSNELASTTWHPVLAPLWDDTSLNGGTCQYLLSGTAPNRVFTIQYDNLKWNYSADNQHNMQVRLYENGKVDFVYGSATGTPNFPSASIGINMGPGGNGWFYSVTPGTPSTASMTAENSSISLFPPSGTIFEFVPTVAAANDMQALSVTGNTTPSVGSATSYVATVRNRGTNAQSNYLVQLVTTTGTVLATMNGTPIQPNEVLNFTLSWTPATEGPLVLRPKVVLTGDENPANDLGQPLSITVMPAGVVVMTIGAGDIQSRVPVDMYWMNSLFETLYYPQEIGMVGNIMALSFYNNFTTNLPNMPTKIWLGTTNQQDLSGGWIPSTQLTQVFDGTVNYPSGQNTIMIPLQTVFTYTGGNLVMMVNRPMDTTYYSSMDNFYAQSVGTNRSRRVQADGTQYDPANPPADATINAEFPKTSIHLTPLGTDPIAMINPNPVNYGQVLMGTTHNRQLSVMNGGGGTLGITNVSISGSPFFQIANPPTLPASLNTGQSIQMNLVYAPTTAGDHAATVTITDDQARVIHTVPLTGSCLDPTIYSLPYGQNFDAVTPPALPLDWSFIRQSTVPGVTVQTYAPINYSPPNSVYMYNSSDAANPLILIAPPFHTTLPVNSGRAHFYARGGSAGVTLSVGIMTDSQNEASFTEVQSITLTSEWAEYIVSFAAYTGAGRYVAFKHGQGSTYQGIYIDNMLLEVIPEHDLATLSVQGNQTPSVGNATQYTATIYNWGLFTENTYTVKLLDANNVELATSPGVSIAPAQSAQVTLNWTPTAEGPQQIKAQVYLAGDQNPLNDPCAPINVTVMPAGMIVMTIGNGDQLIRMPVDMFYRNSIFETLYYPQEIGIFGTVSAISFYADFVTNLPNMPTKIWLGSTQNADLSAGWIPSTELTLVYDGTVNYPNGQNVIMIPLQTPYVYAGGNLVMMVNRPMDTTYYSSQDRFQGQVLTQLRTLNSYSDGTTFDPANPPAATAQAMFPKTSLHMTPMGPDPIFMVNPSSHNYGTVLLNSTHNRNFMVMNAGGGALTINTISISGSPHFSLQNMPTLPASLNTGQSIQFTGRYNPTEAGTHNAVITINDNLRIALGNRNSGRDREPHDLQLSGTCVDPTINTLPYLQNFDAVTAPALPVQWTTLITGNMASITTSTTNPQSPPNCVAMTNNDDNNASIVLVAPPYVSTIATNATRVKFHARASSTGQTLQVGVLTNPQDVSTFTLVQTIELSNTWAEYVVTFGGYTGTGRTAAFIHGLGSTYRTINIDNVMLEYIPQSDLAALSLTGNTTPTMGVATNYIVSVFNWGSNPQTTYQVKLYNIANEELGTAPGVAINPGQTVQIPIGWTPAAEGPATLYAKVIMTGDENNLNDQSPNFNVTVQPPGLLVFTVGDGSESGRIPLDMYYMNSLYECLYYPAELSNTIGMIYGIGFYNSFSSTLMGMPTKIWLGTTTQTDLSAGWIPSTQLTQVFDGTVDYPSGENLIHITFPQPFMYLTGENIVMMAQRPMDTQYYSSMDQFKMQSSTPNRARNAYSDGTAFDPTMPPDGSSSSAFPKTSFFIIPGGVGHLNGVVTGVGNQPLAGVSIQSATGGYSTVTDAQGQYQIINIVADTYSFTFSRYGYIDQTVQIVIPEDETVTHNVSMVQMPVVTVSGTIIGSDTGTGLSGAAITMHGYEDYSANTNTEGIFNIPGVYANHSYDYTIICPGYQNAAGVIQVGAGNYSFGNITLAEVAYAPRQVHGTVNEFNTAALLEWQAPDPNALDVLESFENDIFPPENWTQTITNTGPANTSGVYPTWCRFPSVTISGEPVTPPDGFNQGGLWWSYDHQDEWLKTPNFNCPPAAYLRFWSHVFLGSTNGDHYYIKISTDDGATWTTLWDASAQTGGWNSYASPIVIDLATYEGLQVKIAWHAEDPPTNDGLWYVWFIDDIYIGNEVTGVSFMPSTLERSSASGSFNSASSPSFVPDRNSKAEFVAQPRSSVAAVGKSPTPQRHSQRTLVGYKIWRLPAGQEDNPVTWTLITDQTITQTSHQDDDWATLPNGTYRWAVKAVYTADVLSVPVFSNPLEKQIVSGYISGVVRTTQNAPINGATVSAGSYSATTNTAGAYSIYIPVGNWSVTASKTGYVTQTIDDVIVIANQTTTVNFQMVPGTENANDVIPITATELLGNYPNPFNPETTLSFALKDAGRVKLRVFNLKGQLIRELVDQDLPSGYHKFIWNGRDQQGRPVASGVYCYRLETGNYDKIKKMILMQ